MLFPLTLDRNYDQIFYIIIKLLCETNKAYEVLMILCTTVKLMRIMVQMGRVDGAASQGNKKEIAYAWTDVLEKNPKPSSVPGSVNRFVVLIILILLYTLSFLFGGCSLPALQDIFTFDIKKKREYICMNVEVILLECCRKFF